MVKVITRERQAHSWSISELARRTGMANSTVGLIERGRFIPYASQLGKLARALEWTGSPAELLEDVAKDA